MGWSLLQYKELCNTECAVIQKMVAFWLREHVDFSVDLVWPCFRNSQEFNQCVRKITLETPINPSAQSPLGPLQLFQRYIWSSESDFSGIWSPFFSFKERSETAQTWECDVRICIEVFLSYQTSIFFTVVSASSSDSSDSWSLECVATSSSHFSSVLVLYIVLTFSTADCWRCESELLHL